ncbi:MAG: hypothetical protein N4A65_11830 [Cohaesibacter sp.]|jgi:hypothetical protein|nr:hypothetical protein [Cohaesibacter sp.]
MISFLHTAQSNADLFSDEMARAGLAPASHHVKPDLLKEVSKGDGIGPDLHRAIVQSLEVALEDGSLLLCTCSSLGGVADELAAKGLPILRTDALLAKAFLSHAAACDPAAKCAVIVVAPGTVHLTARLFEAMQQQMGASGLQIDVIVLDKVWDLFLAGDHEGYLSGLASSLDVLTGGNQYYSHFALAQASMASAVQRCLSPAAKAVWTVPAATCDYLLALQSR